MNQYIRPPFQLLQVIVLIFLIGCDSTTEPQLIEPVDHIQYFGFTLVDTSWDDPTDEEFKTNYNNEVAAFSNVADILAVNPEDNIVNRMKAMQELQMKSIIHVNEIFFQIEGTNAPSGTDYKLRADAQERWDTFLDTNSLYLNQDLIQAIYVGEEPTWNGISFAELKKVADYVKLTIPDITVMVIEAYPTLNEFRIPESVDWVGFDHYFIKDPKNDATFKAELQVLKSKLSEEQKLILVMDTHYIDFAHGDFGGIMLNEMGTETTSYYELAKAEPKTIAILGYFWPSGFDQANSIGARHMPEEVKKEYVKIGKQITDK